jgi:hypothetical protein
LNKQEGLVSTQGNHLNTEFYLQEPIDTSLSIQNL